jgi:hypothetical protein
MTNDRYREYADTCYWTLGTNIYHFISIYNFCWRPFEEEKRHVTFSRMFSCNVTPKRSHYTPWRRFGGEQAWFLLIHDFGSRCVWVVRITPRPRFTAGKGPLYPLDRRLDGPPRLSVILLLVLLHNCYIVAYCIVLLSSRAQESRWLGLSHRYWSIV